MCEVDFSGEVQAKNYDNEWLPFEVLAYDKRWPNVVFGSFNGSCPCTYVTTNGMFRNTPPPPPEVWVVWRKQDDKVWYYGTYHEPVSNLPSEDFWQQKVTCEGPVW